MMKKFKRLCASVALITATLMAIQTLTPAGAAPGEITIVRDQFGVPHVFANSAEDAAYGVGYALAQDRMWQMHVFRRIGKGRLSEIFGPLVIEIDKTVRFFTYTAEERAARYETYPDDLKKQLEAFVDGINAHFDEARTNPALLPLEFTQYGEVPEDWTVDDSLALQDVLILSFGSGGGDELAHAALLDALIEKVGKKKAKAMFNDLIPTVDPDAPTTIPRGYNWRLESTFARTAEAEARRKLEDDARLSLQPGGQQRAAAGPEPAAGTIEQLKLIPDPVDALKQFEPIRRGLEKLQAMFQFGSNAQLAGPKLSEHGNSLQTGGPQVGYLIPQWLADFGMHGGNVDATGMTFAGAGPAVLIGRGTGYAWTTTTGASDLMDTYVEKLAADDDRKYMFNGTPEDMDCRTEVYMFKDAVPQEEQEICRTRHGPVVAFDEENKVAYSLRYSWFNREGQTVEGFFRYGEVKSMEDFGTFSNYLGSNHNMFYSDDLGNIGYWHPGNHVKRKRGIDIRLPQDGRGGSEWRGLLPIQKVPHAVNPPSGWIANWNNQPAPNWKRERAHPALDNVIDLNNALNPKGPALKDPFGGLLNDNKDFNFDEMSANLRYAAMTEHEHTYFKKFIPRPRTLKKDVEKKAARLLRKWTGSLVDLDEDGLYDSAGPAITRAWVPSMMTLAFDRVLGEPADDNIIRPFATTSLLWHLLNQRDRRRLQASWLRLRPKELAKKAFEQTVAALAEEFGNEDPKTWKIPIDLEHYTRLNADTLTDIAECESEDCSEDSGRPGDVRDHISMDRGTYNHVIQYSDVPAGSLPLGQSEGEFGSVIPPGQSGFINQAGQEHPHYETQLELYEQWKYKPMPMTLAEARALKEDEYVITRP